MRHAIGIVKVTAVKAKGLICVVLLGASAKRFIC
jgi:hypothetical protein